GGSCVLTSSTIDRYARGTSATGVCGSHRMQCSHCHAENREGRRFCARCGALLPLACASCGFANELGDQFCGGCGHPLVRPAVERDSEQRNGGTGDAPAAVGGRGQTHLMFCGFVGFPG